MKNPKIDEFGTQRWYNKNNLLHRLDRPAVIYKDGSELWYQNGLLHRIEGQTVILENGSELWYINGKCHREDGPAIIRVDGTQRWFINDIEYTEEDYLKEINYMNKLKELL